MSYTEATYSGGRAGATHGSSVRARPPRRQATADTICSENLKSVKNTSGYGGLTTKEARDFLPRPSPTLVSVTSWLSAPALEDSAALPPFGRPANKSEREPVRPFGLTAQLGKARKPQSKVLAVRRRRSRWARPPVGQWSASAPQRTADTHRWDVPDAQTSALGACHEEEPDQLQEPGEMAQGRGGAGTQPRSRRVWGGERTGQPHSLASARPPRGPIVPSPQTTLPHPPTPSAAPTPLFHSPGDRPPACAQACATRVTSWRRRQEDVACGTRSSA